MAVRNQAILDAIPDTLFYLSRDGKVLDCKLNGDLSSSVLSPTSQAASLSDILHLPSDLVLSQIEQTLDSAGVKVFECQLPLPEEPQDFEVRLVASGPIRSWIWAYNPNLPVVNFDPANANALLIGSRQQEGISL